MEQMGQVGVRVYAVHGHKAKEEGKCEPRGMWLWVQDRDKGWCLAGEQGTRLCRVWLGSQGCLLLPFLHVSVVTREPQAVLKPGAGRVRAASFLSGQGKHAQVLEEMPPIHSWLPTIGGHRASPKKGLGRDLAQQ